MNSPAAFRRARESELADRGIGEIYAWIGRRRMNPKGLATKLGVPQQWLARRLDGTTPISLQDLELIASGLDVDPLILLVAPSGNPPATAAVAPDSDTSVTGGKQRALRSVPYAGDRTMANDDEVTPSLQLVANDR